MTGTNVFESSGLYAEICGTMLEYYDRELGIGLDWQSFDGCMTMAPLGGESTGKNPTDRESRVKPGTEKRPGQVLVR